jgi:small subunit ribosomal protein S3
MGQKVNPVAIRLGITREWVSKWYAGKKLFPQHVHTDFRVREFLKKKLADASVSRILIDRAAKRVNITIQTARPGIVIGRKREGIEKQIEKRVMFRRAMKRAVMSTMRSGALGVKVRLSGRLNGSEIARTEWAREGRVPLHTFRADIDYGLGEARTTYGVIGVKVWIFKGEVFDKAELAAQDANVEAAQAAQGAAANAAAAAAAATTPAA